MSPHSPVLCYISLVQRYGLHPLAVGKLRLSLSFESCLLPLRHLCNRARSYNSYTLIITCNLLFLPPAFPKLTRRSRPTPNADPSSSVWSIDPQPATAPQHFCLESTPPWNLELSPGLQAWVFGTYPKAVFSDVGLDFCGFPWDPTSHALLWEAWRGEGHPQRPYD